MSRFPDKFNISSAKNKRNKFDLSCDQITTSGFMRPKISYVKEVVPGDKIFVNMETFVRTAPMVAPTFGRVNLYNRFFFVPMRTICDHWTEFITQTPFYKDSSVITATKVPYFLNSDIVKLFTTGGPLPDFYSKTVTSGNEDFSVEVNNVTKYYAFTGNGMRLYDIFINLGYSINWSLTDTRELSALPFLAYVRVLVDYYYPPQYAQVSWRFHHLFEQMASDPHVDLINAQFEDIFFATSYDPDYFVSAWDNPSSPNGTNAISPSVIADDSVSINYGRSQVESNSSSGTPVLDGRTNYGANQASPMYVSSYIIHVLDKVTDYIRRHQIAGYRQLDRFLAQFGKRLDDTQLRRSVHLHTDEFPLRISDIVSSADTASSSGLPLGYQGGKALAYSQGKQFNFDSNDDFGYLICIQTIVPKIGYYQGTRRDNLHIGPMDFYQPQFDGCGSQAIAMQEFFSSSHHENYFAGMVAAGYGPNSVFGFCPRFTEYKVGNDVLSGNFRLPRFSTSLTPYQLMRTVGEEWEDAWVSGDSEDYYKHNFGFVTGSDASQYNRIFTSIGTGDNFIVINHAEVHASREMLSIIDGVEFYDKDHVDGNKDITISNGGKVLN